jgi:hypothetical protein
MPRIHIACGQSGGQFALALVEHMTTSPVTPTSKMGKECLVQHAETRPKETLDQTKDRVLALIDKGAENRPVLFIDVSGPGSDLWAILNDAWGKEHWMTSYKRSATLLTPRRDDFGKPGVWREAERRLMIAYTGGSLVLDDGLANRQTIVRALASFERGKEGPGSALVAALALAVAYPTEGAPPRHREKDGSISFNYRVSPDTYLSGVTR